MHHQDLQVLEATERQIQVLKEVVRLVVSEVGKIGLILGCEAVLKNKNKEEVIGQGVEGGVILVVAVEVAVVQVEVEVRDVEEDIPHHIRADPLLGIISYFDSI